MKAVFLRGFLGCCGCCHVRSVGRPRLDIALGGRAAEIPWPRAEFEVQNSSFTTKLSSAQVRSMDTSAGRLLPMYIMYMYVLIVIYDYVT